MGKVLSLDDFKDMVNNNPDFKQEITHRKDIIDKQNGIMRIYPENVNKYLEEYYCKNVEDLQDRLYYTYGIFCTVIE
jgi:predicted HAD superfamily Cof-like phosphohydrolase